MIQTGRARMRSLLLGSTALSMLLSPAVGHAQSLPSGGVVTHGEAAIVQSGSSLLVTQSSRNAILNWNSFSVSGGASAHFDNGSGATLNRVSGNLPTSIDGSLTATGSLYLVNAAGIAVGTGGMVRTGGSFVASTHDLSDADFLKGGDMVLSGTSKAGIVNEGVIASLGGDVVLTARRVENKGTLLAPKGDVGLLAGYEVLLRDLATGDGKFAVRVGGTDTQVVNSGTISAVNAELRANGGNVHALAGNTKGVITATGVKKQGGRIFLTAGEGGSVTVTQRIVAKPAPQRQAAAKAPAAKKRPAASTSGGVVRISADKVTLGGEIDVSGDTMQGGSIIAVAKEQLELTAGAKLDVSGADGGTILLGGDYQGGAKAANTYWPEAIGTTQTTLVAAGATIVANGTSGVGGNVVVWGDGHTGFAGKISATGVTRGGDAEVSGKATLAYNGTADLRASDGAFGTLLLDPYNITIVAGSGGTVSGGTFTGAANSTLGATTLLAALNSANVTVSTGAAGSAGGDAGTITVNAALAWNTAATLRLEAANNIVLNNAITARAGGLTLSAGGTITTGAGGAVEVARFTLERGNWTQNGASLPGFAAGDFRITGGTFLRALGGAGTAGTPWLLGDIYGVQGMATYLGNSFALANDVDASGTKHWWNGAGFVPVGNVSGNSFTGRFDGQGHVISGLTINRGTEYYVGLFGRANGATIANIGIDGGSVTGRDDVGGLVGYQSGGSISQSWASGAVSGTATSHVDVGGLVGVQSDNGSISQSWASGTVSGTATGINVISFVFAGGLVGYQSGGSISQSWASGAVSGTRTSAGNVYAGGLVGNRNFGTITASYWDRETSGRSQGVGNVSNAAGVTGLSTVEARSAASYTGWVFTGPDAVWYHDADLRPILRSSAGPTVNGVTYISSMLQLQLMDANRAGSYALTRDLDAAIANGSNSAGIWGAGGFVPVGRTNALSFTGRFDGQGHVISGLTINRGGENHVGLFGRTFNATIANIGIDGGRVAGRDYVGGLVGYQTGGSISQSWSSGAVSALSSSGEAGGLVGRLSSGSIVQSYATGAVNAPWSAGGLVGYQDGGSISQSWSSGAVSGTGTGNVYAGGLVGYQAGGSISQSWSSGAVSGTRTGTGTGTVSVGGLVGYRVGGTIAASYWDLGTSGRTQGVGNVGNAAGVTGLTTAEARNATSYVGWDFTDVWYQVRGLRPILRSSAGPVIDGVTQISSMLQLQLMGANLSGSYVLTRDLDATIANGSDGAGIWGGGGFVPVGRGANGFSGVFDGQGHVISGLVMNRGTEEDVGLFGRTNNATIANIGIDGASISGGTYLGGLVGRQIGGSISQSWVRGRITANSNLSHYAGGLVGYHYNGSISQSWASGAVSGNYNVGGLVGAQNFGSISQSWANGTTTGNHYVGGLVGYQFDNSSITQSYATGTVSITTDSGQAGGLVGVLAGGTITASYWDKDTSERGVGSGSTAGVTGLTTAEFQDTAGFVARARAAGWDFETIWAPPSAGYYPTLYTGQRVAFVETPSFSRVYGDANPVLALPRYYGLRPGEFLITEASVTGLPALTANVGTYTLAASGGAATADYRFVHLAGTAEVTKRAITISAADLSRIYGDGNPALTFGTTIGGAGLASFHGNLAAAGYGLSTVATAQSDAGEYAITLTGSNGNYAVSFNPGKLTVDRRAITISANDLSRIYGNANPALIFGTMIGGDGLATHHVSLAAAGYGLSTVATAQSGTGGYAITLTGANSNYDVSFDAGVLTIDRRAITISANDLSRIYGNANPALSWTVGGLGLVNGDTLSGALATVAGQTSGVGSYAITQGSLSAGANYDVSFDEGTLSVDRRAITISAADLSRIYGNANPALTWTVGGLGLVNGDTLSGALATAASQTSGVGSYAITQGSLSAGGNYAVTFDAGTLTVDRRAITISAADLSRIYGNANPALTWTVGGLGLVNGDVLSGALATAAGQTSGVGSYAITQGSLAAGGNYDVSFAEGTLSIDRRAITISAADLSRIYGNANPALTWTVGGLGLVNGDVLSGALATAAGQTSGVGSYAITQGSLAAGSNYDVSFDAGTLTVDRRAITISAEDVRKLLGTSDPALSWSLTGGSLASFDTLGAVFSGGLLREAGELPGSYGIGQGMFAANANYSLTFLPGTFSIDPVMHSDASALERSRPPQPNPALTAWEQPAAGTPPAACTDGGPGTDACEGLVHPDNRAMDFVRFAP